MLAPGWGIDSVITLSLFRRANAVKHFALRSRAQHSAHEFHTHIINPTFASEMV